MAFPRQILDELEIGMMIGGRNINSLWYADNTTLLSQNEEAIKQLIPKVKAEREKAELHLNITKAMTTGSGDRKLKISNKKLS